MSDLDTATELARARLDARAEKDFAKADELREQIRALGFEVVDGADGFELRPATAEASAPTRVRAQDVESVLDAPSEVDVTVQLLVQQGWPQDALRAIEACRAALAGRSVQFVVVDAADTPDATWPADEDVEIVALAEDPGWGAARNAGLRRARGHTVIVLDGSIEPSGDLGTLLDALEDPSCGVAGPIGIITDDLREFRDSSGLGEDRHVDAIEGYLMAFRRARLSDAGLFDEKFRFYRSADIEYSFRIRSLGLAARIVDVPFERHEHRMWNAFPEAERDRLSKRNFYRFLERWRDRPDLASGAEEG